jgi:hypothetical protein
MNNENENENEKNGFIENVKKWIVLENQLKMENEKIRKIREDKNKITSQMYYYMNSHNIIDKNIVVKDGELSFYEKKDYSPLTFTYIEKCLTDLIDDKSHINYIIQYIRENREHKIYNDIRKIIRKNKYN